MQEDDRAQARRAISCLVGRRRRYISVPITLLLLDLHLFHITLISTSQRFYPWKATISLNWYVSSNLYSGVRP